MFGISDTNTVKVDSADVREGQLPIFTSSGIKNIASSESPASDTAEAEGLIKFNSDYLFISVYDGTNHQYIWKRVPLSSF